MKDLGLYILTEETTVRYYAVGTMMNENFTGIVYGYVGGGCYDDALVYKGKFLPEEDMNGLEIEPQENEDLFTTLVQDNFLGRCYDLLDEVCHFNSDSTLYEINKEIEPNSVITLGEKIHPISYANTTFDNDDEVWNMEDLLLEQNPLIKQHCFFN